jgi:phosphatidate cytidylyltransferase
MHLKRWITGLVALPFLIFIIIKGGVLFSAFIGLIALIGFWEYTRVVFSDSGGTARGIIVPVAYLFIPMFVGAAHYHATDLMFHLFTLYFILTAFLSVLLYNRDRLVYETTKKTVLGVAYIPVLLSYLILIRDGEQMEGAKWIIFTLAIVFAGDIGALYTGTFFGKHKLNPAVSPKKTLEGSLGGIIVNIIIGVCFKALLLPELSWGVSVLFFISLGIAGQVGDLFESGLKRVAKVKDSGGIFPGHGGILDRADATMFAAPVAYLFKMYLF